MYKQKHSKHICVSNYGNEKGIKLSSQGYFGNNNNFHWTIIIQCLHYYYHIRKDNKHKECGATKM